MNESKKSLTAEEEALFNKWLQQKKNFAENSIKECLEQVYPEKKAIHDVMNYAMYNGGKRLRPILVFEGAEIAGMELQRAVPAACALEMIHCYSLVHDDLPAMDDDDYRRGKLSCHKAFGEDMAILAGDALLTGAFEVLAGAICYNDLERTRLLRVIGEIALAAGSNGMISGQVLDLKSEDQNINQADLREIHELKTGRLFVASLRAGAILGGLDAESLEELTLYAENFGLAFQITDDILDVIGNEQDMGKPIGSDEKSHKATYPGLFGMEKAQEMARESVINCIDNLRGFGTKADFLRYLAYYLLGRSN